MNNEYSGFRLPSVNHTLDVVDPDAIDPKVFFDRYVSTRTPCILSKFPRPKVTEGDTEPWSWFTVDELVKRAGNSVVSVERRDSRLGRFGSGRKRERMELADLMCQLHGQNQELYMTTQYDDDRESNDSLPIDNLHDNLASDQEIITNDGDSAEWEDESDGSIPILGKVEHRISDYASPPLDRLVNRIPITLELFGNLTPHLMNLWIGSSNDPKGTSSGLHHDFHDNFYLLHSGCKRFTIFSPHDTASMYLHGKIKRVHPNGLQEYIGASNHEIRGDGAFLEDVAAYHLRTAQDDLDNAVTPSEIDHAERALDIAMEELLEFQTQDDSSSINSDANNDSDSDVLIANSDSVKRSASISFGSSHPVDSKRLKEATTAPLLSTDASKSEPPSFSCIPISTLDQYISDQILPPEYEQLGNAIGISFNLNPGEGLYLPAGWFHEVRSFGSTSVCKSPLHMALNFWLEPPTSNDFTKPYPDPYWSDVRWKPLQQCIAAHDNLK
ncbi:hypothetical protein BASA81_018279 [Batrachochytrium salamandrivorans]|nr:hypothetical protein BASA81_018279 [Batrachochytrium salamandrivorans]